MAGGIFHYVFSGYASQSHNFTDSVFVRLSLHYSIEEELHRQLHFFFKFSDHSLSFCLLLWLCFSILFSIILFIVYVIFNRYMGIGAQVAKSLFRCWTYTKYTNIPCKCFVSWPSDSFLFLCVV